MNKILKNLTYIFALTLLSFNISCEDIADEVKTLQNNRLFSPTKLDVRILNRTSARVEWEAVDRATSYTIQVFDNSTEDYEDEDQIIREVADILFSEVPYTLTDFDGETTYSIRVKAVGELPDSKWTSTTFKTDSEQIFVPMTNDDIVLDEETLLYNVSFYWPAGEPVTSIVLTWAIDKEEYKETYRDLGDGFYTITGLPGDIKFTAKLMNDKKTRGTAEFTTPVDLNNATLVTPDNDLKSLISNAAANTVFALQPGEYNINGNLQFGGKNIALKGVKVGDRPVLKGAMFRLSEGAGLELQNLILDRGNESSDKNQTIVLTEKGAYGNIIIDNCDITNYDKGIIYATTNNLMESFTITGSYLYDIPCNGGDFIDFRSGIAKEFTFINNTVNNCAESRDLFRMDEYKETEYKGQKSIITINNNIFHKSAKGASNRILYIRLGDDAKITFNRNIISESEGYYTNFDTTNIVETSENNYYNAIYFYTRKPGIEESVYQYIDNSNSYTTQNPGYANPDAGNFKLSNDNLSLKEIGPSKWW